MIMKRKKTRQFLLRLHGAKSNKQQDRAANVSLNVEITTSRRGFSWWVNCEVIAANLYVKELHKTV